MGGAAWFAAFDVCERIRLGGPVWTSGESSRLAARVREELVEEFGEERNPDEKWAMAQGGFSGWPTR